MNMHIMEADLKKLVQRVDELERMVRQRAVKEEALKEKNTRTRSYRHVMTVEDELKNAYRLYDNAAGVVLVRDAKIKELEMKLASIRSVVMDDSDVWYAAEVERMKERAPA
jgi:hypothetical protein